MRHVHHIIPKWLGGTDDWWNLESVTIKEHFIIHLRIARFLNTRSSWNAVTAILNNYPELGLFRKHWFKRFGNALKNNHHYRYCKALCGEDHPLHGTTHSRNKGSNNPMFKGYCMFEGVKYSNINELSKKLGKSSVTIRNWAKEGKNGLSFIKN